MKTVGELVDAEHDFDRDESMLVDRDEAPYPKDAAEASELWRQRIKFLLLEKLASGTELADARKELRKRFRSLSKRMHQTDRPELLQLYLTAATMTFDPHTTYLSPSTLENFEIDMRLELEGIGAALSSVDGETVVTQIIAGGAADRDGRLQPQDTIDAVAEGKGGEFVDTLDMKLTDVVRLIRGKSGSIVRLRITHAESKATEVLEITRAKVELKYSEAYGEVIEVESPASDDPLRVGVIDLPSFYMDMSREGRDPVNFKSSTRDVREI